jgi:hypothetical protein
MFCKRGRFERSIYSISGALKGPFEAVDAGSGLDKRGARVVPDVHVRPGPHRVLRRPPGAVQVSALQGDLDYVLVMEGMSDSPENLPSGGLEVHG